VVFSVRRAAGSHAQSHDGVQPLLDLPNQPDHFFGAFHRNFDLDDGREHLLAENILAQRPFRNIAHQRSEWIPRLECNIRRCQSNTHFLNFAHPNTDAWTAEFNGEADFTHVHPAGNIIGLYLLGTTAFDARRFVRNSRIGKRAPHHAGPT
jgi:hypothetical protein